MAPARRARSPNASQPLYADDDQDSEPETPRPKKSQLKKRLSEIHSADQDASFTPDSGRAPLRTVVINDDEAEKRRRRKSTKIHAIANALAGPSSEGMQEPSDPAAQAATKQKQQLNTIAAPVINVPKEVMNSNYEEWMKMATDNKINATNSWTFALIDYFHDMSLLRNQDDNTINFQRASCTLDGCVKIWTSRVDSVGTETGKLLNNLEEGGKNDDDDDDGDNSDNPDGDPSQSKKRRANRGTGATLAKDPAQLKNKKPDLEYSVDPLFKKTSEDFDEGGASGLLMNHLALGIGSDGAMRVIFDASDPMGKVEEEDIVEEPHEPVNLSYLRQTFFPDLSVLEHKAISHTLTDFSFSKGSFVLNDATFLENSTRHMLDDDDNDDDTFGMNLDAGDEGPVEDFFVGADAINDDFGGDMMGGDDFDGDNGSNGGEPAGGGEDGPPGAYVPFDPRQMPNQRDVVLAMTNDEEGGALDYFDQNFLKNWAGPEHWKLRKAVRKPEGDAANKPNKRQKKEPVTIDFTTPLEKDLKELTKEMFAPVTKGVGINLPGTGTTVGKRGKKKKEKRDDHRLPDDMHFSSRQLLTLFLKPKFFLKMRGKRARMNENGDGEIDENFWAQAAADQAAQRDGDMDDDGNDMPAPFNTQFFQDDDFPGGFDDDGGYDEGGGVPDEDAGEQDLLAVTANMTRRARPEFVKYTKRAKRVDVRKLKENIWKGLDIVIKKEPEPGADESMDVDDDQPAPTDPSEARQFSQVISGLQQSYPREKMEEISTSFCFICLLHLANEQGLKLESAVEGLTLDDPAEEEPEAKTDKKVGDIWDIKIYRDPNATQSA